MVGIGERIGPRLTLEEQISRNRSLRERPLAIEFRTRGGNLLRAADVIGKQLQTIQALALKIDILRENSFIPEMLVIPAGSFKMGSAEHQDEQPIRTINISRFAIGKYEVNNAEYRTFVNETGREITKEMEARIANTSLDRHPVGAVNFHDAVAYCRWLSEKTGRKFRLPTEAEWEHAARGTDGRIYPWGNEWDASKVTSNVTETMPVDAHPEGASPFGVMDLAGNVWEWVLDWSKGYDSEELTDPKGPKIGTQKILRGGAHCIHIKNLLRTTNRDSSPPERRDYYIGFRVAEDI